MVGFAICLLVTLVVVKISHWLYRWVNPKCSGKLPPGSMGFPVIGETFEFFKSNEFYELTPFLKKRMSRYGPMFRTSILGLKAVISTDPEVNFEIFKQNQSFVHGYPDSIVRIFGKKNLFFQQGNFHKYIRNLASQFFGSESLKRRLIHEMDRASAKHLQRAASRGTFDVKETAINMIIESITKKITSHMEPETAKELEDNWKSLRRSWFRFSFNIPGTTLHKFLLARRRACKIIKGIIDEKKASKSQCDDFLDTLFEEMKKEDSVLSEDRAIDIIFTLLLLSQETTPTLIAIAVKLIADHPKVLEELKNEHETVLRNRTKEEQGVTWQEYKSMSFTHMVINESLRMSIMQPAMYRKAAHDVEIKGYTIPAGWYVFGIPFVHFDPETYDEPFSFNPWRWQGKELHSGSKTFMAFGGGARLCAGAEYAKLQVTIFLHYLVTNYRWSVVEGAQLVRAPMVTFPNGVHINIL